MNTSKNLIRLVTIALLAALCCVATLVIQIPTPTGGFVNLGDTVILLSAFLLPPVYAAAAGGLGSMLADILAGYVQYAPATFVIKALMALVACLILKTTKKLPCKNRITPLLSTILAAICAESIMVAGYFVFEAFILQYGAGGALASVLPNTMQGIAGIAGGTLLCEIFKRTKIYK